MKVYLLNPPFIPHFGRAMRWQDTGRGGTLYYPIWLAYATGVLEQAGFETRLADAPAWGWDQQQVIEDIKSFQPGLLVMDSSFPSLNNDLSVAEGLKTICPDIKIVLVGPPASQMPDRILRSTGIDIVARLEYDLTLKELAQALESGQREFDHISGISYRTDDKIKHNQSRPFTGSEDLDKMPFVSQVYKRHLNLKDYFLGNSLFPEVQIFSGRGCPHQCTFCSWPQTLTGRKYRTRSVANVMDELGWIENSLPEVKEVFFEDDTFTINRDRVHTFTREYLNKGLGIIWSCNARADLDYETMKLMKQANCRLLIVGYESGSETVLKNIKKGVTVDKAKKFARDARRAGLLVNGDFVIGMPGETKETIELTQRLIREVKPDILQVSVATPFPGTEFYSWCQANGCLAIDNPDEYLDERGHQRAVISYPALSDEEMVKAVDEILKEYYLNPGYILTASRRLFRRQGANELKVLCRSALTFMKYLRGR